MLLFLKRHAHSGAMWMPGAGKIVRYLFICHHMTSSALFVRLVLSCSPRFEGGYGLSTLNSLKQGFFFFFTLDVSFVLSPEGGAGLHSLPVQVNGEVLDLWEAVGESSSYCTYYLCNNLATQKCLSISHQHRLLVSSLRIDVSHKM